VADSITSALQRYIREAKRAERRVRDQARSEPRRIVAAARAGWAPPKSGRTDRSWKVRASIRAGVVRVVIANTARNRRRETYASITHREGQYERPLWVELVQQPVLEVFDGWAASLTGGGV
jgi:hypothetical protein